MNADVFLQKKKESGMKWNASKQAFLLENV
jgi:hypothetical protein